MKLNTHISLRKMSHLTKIQKRAKGINEYIPHSTIDCNWESKSNENYKPKQAT